ncbi:hypothetical protein AB6A40_001858 [Gnathostoma spinigerum]|uniref:Diphosphomevalonate decarboxylase n=1 Tax=Gnathostoma spinigerum TaxID=75299 RepID=A0ABD6E568_9BILA
MSRNEQSYKEVEVVAPINIALIKYWGKKDENLMIPLNDSLSLNIDEVFARTVLRTGSSIEEDRVTVNGKEINLSNNQRFQKCFAEVRRILRKRRLSAEGDGVEALKAFDRFYVTSTTNFPTDAGLASSAAGFAAIAFAFGKMFSLRNKEVARIARLGSGSACRSLFSGLVHWKAGYCEDGSDCTCESVASMDSWSSLRAMILVTSNIAKSVGSSDGMRMSVESSGLLHYRASAIVPSRLWKCVEAFKTKNFGQLADIVMKESNQLHAICLDTKPPIKYLADISWHLIDIVEKLNEKLGRTVVAYTFDAGPNCCLFMESKSMFTVLAAINNYCSISDALLEKTLEKMIALGENDAKKQFDEECSLLVLDGINVDSTPIQDVILSRLGSGPEVKSQRS